jgi:UDP-N-acetylglucosamine 4,6-dehydratase
MIGDVRDYDRLCWAMDGCDTVIHAAAMKQVPTCEYNPQEAIKTNVIGTMNVINACHAMGVERCIVVSSDKACQPINLYGATKMCLEKVAIAGNNLGSCKISVVRYGNVIGSRGSVLPLWDKQYAETGAITITDNRMTRFWISIDKAVNFIFYCFDGMQGGEVFVPKMMSCTMESLARDRHPDAKITYIGIRQGEKLHECMVGEDDARDCVEELGRYVIYPQYHDWIPEYHKSGDFVGEDFRYVSCDTKKICQHEECEFHRAVNHSPSYPCLFKIK